MSDANQDSSSCMLDLDCKAEPFLHGTCPTLALDADQCLDWLCQQLPHSTCDCRLVPSALSRDSASLGLCSETDKGKGDEQGE